MNIIFTSQPSAVGGSFLFLRSARRHADFKGLPFLGFVFEGGDCGGWSFGGQGWFVVEE